MNTVNYPERKAFTRFDDRHFALYLGEEAISYAPDHTEPGDDVPAPSTPPAPVEGYSYTGPMADGGTMVAATEATYEAFVSGLVRRRYSADDVEALHVNKTETLGNAAHPRAEEFAQAWEEFQTYRAECKAAAREVLDREVS